MTQPGDEAADTAAGLFPIRAVCSMTGLNPVTLRAWERRYGLIKPRRTSKGHRLYAQADIDRINETVRLLDRGVPVGQVRGILDGRDDAAAVADPPPGDHWGRYLQAMMQAIERFDHDRLDAAYNEALSLYPVDTVTRLLVVPLLRELGRRWETAQGGVAEEHFFSVYLRNKLGARFHHLRAEPYRPRLLAACLPEERHEFGLLIFCLLAKSAGYDVVLLGAAMPLEELPAAAGRGECAAIVLAAGRGYAHPGAAQELKAMAAKARMPVFVGGAYSVEQRDAVTAAGAVPLGEDMGLALRLIRRHVDHVA